jgi:hypothetical protein
MRAGEQPLLIFERKISQATQDVSWVRPATGCCAVPEVLAAFHGACKNRRVMTNSGQRIAVFTGE